MPNSEERRTQVLRKLREDLFSDRKIVLFKDRMVYDDNHSRPVMLEAQDLAPVEKLLVEGLSYADAQRYFHERAILAQRFAEKIS